MTYGHLYNSGVASIETRRPVIGTSYYYVLADIVLMGRASYHITQDNSD